MDSLHQTAMAAVRYIFDQIENDIRDYYNRAVTIFYKDYSPIVYIRKGDVSSQTNGLYEALVITRKGLNLDCYLDDSKLPEHKQDNSAVYDLNISAGIHGGNQASIGNPAPITRPSIEAWMDNFWEDYKAHKLNQLLMDAFRKFIFPVIRKTQGV